MRTKDLVDVTDADFDDLAHLPGELWMVVITAWPASIPPDRLATWEQEQIERGVPREDRGFYWPKVSNVYRSRSSARNRLAIFEYYGARGVIVRAHPQWQLVESKDEQIARLEARVAELEGRAA